MGLDRNLSDVPSLQQVSLKVPPVDLRRSRGHNRRAWQPLLI
jgi:hypothetical protein